MDILRGVPAYPANHDLLTIIRPFQNRARAYAKLPANRRWYRDLTLCRELRMRDCHVAILPR